MLVFHVKRCSPNPESGIVLPAADQRRACRLVLRSSTLRGRTFSRSVACTKWQTRACRSPALFCPQDGSHPPPLLFDVCVCRWPTGSARRRRWSAASKSRRCLSTRCTPPPPSPSPEPLFTNHTFPWCGTSPFCTTHRVRFNRGWSDWDSKAGVLTRVACIGAPLLSLWRPHTLRSTLVVSNHGPESHHAARNLLVCSCITRLVTCWRAQMMQEKDKLAHQLQELRLNVEVLSDHTTRG